MERLERAGEGRAALLVARATIKVIFTNLEALSEFSLEGEMHQYYQEEEEAFEVEKKWERKRNSK